MLFDFFSRRRGFKEYQRLRIVSRELNEKLLNTVPIAVFKKSAKKLGLLYRGEIFASEDEIPLLMDYCIYNHFDNKGRNIVQRYLQKNPPPPDSDEMRLLQAMSNSFYSIFGVKKRRRNSGVYLADLLSTETIFLKDIGLSKTARKGVVIASRVMNLGDYFISSGATIALPGDFVDEKIIPITQKIIGDMTVQEPILPKQQALLAARVIRVSVKAGVVEMSDAIDV